MNAEKDFSHFCTSKKIQLQYLNQNQSETLLDLK